MIEQEELVRAQITHIASILGQTEATTTKACDKWSAMDNTNLIQECKAAGKTFGCKTGRAKLLLYLLGGKKCGASLLQLYTSPKIHNNEKPDGKKAVVCHTLTRIMA